MTLQAAAVDLDGVLVPDTFSPVIRALVEAHGGTYDRETERNVFSQNRSDAAGYLARRLADGTTPDDLLDEYFRLRRERTARHPGGPVPGAGDFLGVLAGAGLRLVCYGGLGQDHFDRELGPLASRFEAYVCTDGFRPGVAQIVARLGLAPAQVLFFDDVSRVAEAARDLGCPFAGVPAPWPWGYQRADMEALGVPVLLDGLEGIGPGDLVRWDGRAARGWWEER